MFVEEDDVLRPWVYGLIQGRPTKPGGFLRAVADAAVRADSFNYDILRPALLQLQAKYPEYRCDEEPAA
jgi:hypothetical protein